MTHPIPSRDYTQFPRWSRSDCCAAPGSPRGLRPCSWLRPAIWLLSKIETRRWSARTLSLRPLLYLVPGPSPQIRGRKRFALANRRQRKPRYSGSHFRCRSKHSSRSNVRKCRSLGRPSASLALQEPLKGLRWRLRLPPWRFFFQKVVSVGNECPNKTARPVSCDCAQVFRKGYALRRYCERGIDVDGFLSRLPLMSAKVENTKPFPKGEGSTHCPHGHAARCRDPVAGPAPGCSAIN